MKQWYIEQKGKYVASAMVSSRDGLVSKEKIGGQTFKSSQLGQSYVLMSVAISVLTYYQHKSLL